MVSESFAAEDKNGSIPVLSVGGGRVSVFCLENLAEVQGVVKPGHGGNLINAAEFAAVDDGLGLGEPLIGDILFGTGAKVGDKDFTEIGI